MTSPPAPGTNAAGGSARVGVQAQFVYGDVTVYQLPANPTGGDMYRTGVRCLDGRMPSRARGLIDAARMEGCDGSEVRFHWLLALLSGRTLGQLSPEEHDQPAAARPSLLPADDAWARAVHLIFRLLDHLATSDVDVQLIVGEFNQLGPEQRDKIFVHLEMLLQGPLDDRSRRLSWPWSTGSGSVSR